MDSLPVKLKPGREDRTRRRTFTGVSSPIDSCTNVRVDVRMTVRRNPPDFGGTSVEVTRDGPLILFILIVC